MTKAALLVGLIAGTLTGGSLPAPAQEKDRCVLQEDAPEKVAECQKLLRKSASPFTRRDRGLLPER
jgi:hypothetical protein